MQSKRVYARLGTGTKAGTRLSAVKAVACLHCKRGAADGEGLVEHRPQARGSIIDLSRVAAHVRRHVGGQRHGARRTRPRRHDPGRIGLEGHLHPLPSRDREPASGCLESDLRINEQLRTGVDPRLYRLPLLERALGRRVPADHRLASTSPTSSRASSSTTTTWWTASDSASRRGASGSTRSEYLAALGRVPLVSHERAEQTISFLADFVGMLTEPGLERPEGPARREDACSARRRYFTPCSTPSRRGSSGRTPTFGYLGANAPFACGRRARRALTMSSARTTTPSRELTTHGPVPGRSTALILEDRRSRELLLEEPFRPPE